MSRIWQVRLGLAGLACCALLELTALWARAEVKFVGRAFIPPTSQDMGDSIDGKHPFRYGGFGALEYTGEGDRYLLVPDRGPDDGVNEFRCRMQLAEIVVNPDAESPVVVRWLSTRILRDEGGKALVGAAGAFDHARPDFGLRFDPEGVRAIGGRIFLSDEYGPAIAEFDELGRRVRLFPVPEIFRIRTPSAVRGEENVKNQMGRISNRGFESLAASPDRKRLYAMTQSPLIQDAVPGEKGWLYGQHCRILEIDLESGRQRQFAYPLHQQTNGVSELLAVGEFDFLALERDDRFGKTAGYKRIVHVDLRDASDISGHDRLPADKLPAGLQPARRRDFADLLAPEHMLAGESLPEKFEGMTFGPVLPDGRRLLLVSVDNDFRVDLPSQVLVFSFSEADLPTYAWRFTAPLSRNASR